MSKYADKLQFEDDGNVSVEAVQKGERTAVKSANIIHRQKIKRGYAKRFRETKKNGKSLKNSAVQTKKTPEKAAVVVTKHPVILGIIGGLLLIIIVLTSIVPSCSNVAINAMYAVFSSSYLANDSDIDDAELAYTEWETDLLLEALNAEIMHSGYDEYRYHIGSIGHNPIDLMGWLTAIYEDFTYAGVESVLREVFAEQYQLSFRPEVETRTRTEIQTDSYTDPVTGEITEYSYEIEVEYEWHILNVVLASQPFLSVITPRMNSDQQEHFALLAQSRGSRQYVGSPFSFEWLPYVSSGYGWRVSPITSAKEFHRGVDIALPEGTEIVAAHAGVVDFAGWDNSYGNYVVITGNNGIATKYAHCSSLLVTEGQTVEAGETIATVGSAGDSTGNHLHYEVLKNNINLNPFFFALTK